MNNGFRTFPNDPFDRRRRLSDLQYELYDVRNTVFDLLDELDAIEILRRHVPASRHVPMDRLETAMRLMDRLNRNIAAKRRPKCAGVAANA